jgi:drug/metabolite transporter (DMT)-like permease
MPDRAAEYASKARDTACKPLELIGRAVEATLFPGAEDRPIRKIVIDAKDTVGAAEQSLENIAEDAYHKMEVALPALVLVTWITATVGLSFVTKWALSSTEKGGAGFAFPVFYTLVTTCGCLIGCTVILALQKQTRTLGVAQFKQSWQGILAVAFFTVLGLWANDSSLMYISLTLNQIFKATTPGPTMVLGYFIERRRYVWPMVVTVVILLVGAVLAVPFDSPDATPYGLVLVSISTLSTAACFSCKARLMANSGENGLTPVVLLFYSSCASVPVLLVWFLIISERTEVGEYFNTQCAPLLRLRLVCRGSSEARDSHKQAQKWPHGGPRWFIAGLHGLDAPQHPLAGARSRTPMALASGQFAR